MSDSVITNPGTAPVLPIFKLPFTAGASFVEVACGEDLVRVGVPPTDGESVTTARTEVLGDDLSTFALGSAPGTPSGEPWTQGTFDTEGGVIAGSFTSDGSGISPRGGSFGTDANGYHGPSINRVIAENAADFAATAQVALNNRTPDGSAALIQVFGLDVNDNALFRLALFDGSPSSVWNRIVLRAGDTSGTKVVNSGSTYSSGGSWREGFIGKLNISRTGRLWTASAQFYHAGHYDEYDRGSWLAPDDTYGADLHSVELKVSQYKAVPVTASCDIGDIRVWKVTTVNPGTPANIIAAGDTVVIDHVNGRVYIESSGVDLIEHLGFGSEFFSLARGSSVVSWRTNGTIAGGKCLMTPEYL